MSLPATPNACPFPGAPTPNPFFFIVALVVEFGLCSAAAAVVDFAFDFTAPPPLPPPPAPPAPAPSSPEVKAVVDPLEVLMLGARLDEEVDARAVVLLRSFFFPPPLKVPPTAPNFFMGERVGGKGIPFILARDDHRNLS